MTNVETAKAATVTGTWDARFRGVRDALEERLLNDDELGASVAIDLDGETVVDIWGGWQDPQRARPWQSNTIVNVWSTTKTVVNLAALLLVERGLLDVDERVAWYWPEFAANGKDDVLVRMLLAHTSGVAGWDGPVSVEDIYDREASVRRLAGQAPWWEPGTASGYHASNQPDLIGELVRRVSGTPIREFVETELASPLDADFRLGVPEADWERVATIVPPPPMQFDLDALDPEGPAVKMFTGPALDASVANTPEWRRAGVSNSGHGNARSVTRLLRVLSLGGEVDGHRLLSPETIELIFREQSHDVDLVLGIPLRFGIGWALPEQQSVPYVGQGRTCYWGGWGGSLVVCDVDRRLTISYMMNKMAPGIIGSDRSEAYVRAAYAAMDASR